MHHQRLRKRQGLADEAPETLAERVVPPLYVCCLASVFSDRDMLFFWYHRLIRLPKIAVTGAVAIDWRDREPQTETRGFRPITDGIGHDLACKAAECNPDPRLIGLLEDK